MTEVMLVTGAGRGIGREVARQLAADGAEVVRTARTQADAEAAAAGLDGGLRIVNVASGAGSHGDTRFGLTTGGGAVASYSISKAAVNALTAKLAAELEGSGVIVNSVCPGLTATAPGIEEIGARPVAEGAASVVWAARLSADGPNGGFLRDGKPLP